MLIYQGLVTLDYDPTTDVLVTSMPDLKQVALAEVSFCLDLIVNSIRNYDIKNVLLDASESVVEVEEASYQAIAKKFSLELISTRLKRIARLGTTDRQREQKSVKLSSELSQQVNSPVAYQNFTNKAEAIAWLVLNKN